MLRRLGKRLTLLNLCISGAILIVMALLALGVAEGLIAKQYESDLGMYARATVAAAFRVVTGELDIAYQVPERYMIYLENDTGGTHLINEAMTDTVTIHTAAVRAKETLALESVEISAIFPSQRGTAGWTGVYARAAGAGILGFETTKEPFFVTAQNGLPMRVSATRLDGVDESGLMLVFQDRTDEIAGRNRMRWLFGGCVALGLTLIFFASLYLSGRAIAPIEKSMRQQREFVAAASHELRTPVAALRANADVLADAQLGEYAPYLESIRSVSERMSLLISDLMDLARADAGELAVRRSPVDADEVALAAARLMRPLAEKRGIALEEEIAPAVLIGDADRLRQALLALLDNGLAYTQAGGRVRVSVAKEGKTVRIAVSDTGPGIPTEHKPYVFDRFYRVDSARSREAGGFGLGLSVVKQLAEQMNGCISLRDAEGGGAVFEMKFQAVE